MWGIKKNILENKIKKSIVNYCFKFLQVSFQKEFEVLQTFYFQTTATNGGKVTKIRKLKLMKHRWAINILYELFVT